MITRRGFVKLACSGFAFGAGLAGFSVTEAMATPKITRYALTPQQWTAGLKLRICALADFHACEPWMSAERIKSICDQAQALDADIILLLGDYVSGMQRFRDIVPAKDWSQAMAGLAAPLGVHAIFGNHDCWQDADFQRDPNRMTFAERALRDIGFSVYVNRAARLEKQEQAFWLAGLGDQMALKPGGNDRSRMLGIDNLGATLTQVTDAAPVLLMAHEPDIFPQTDRRVSLTLSGHTHGGQVDVFGWRPISASAGSRLYPAGHFREMGRDLIVSRGLGCTGLPLRFGSWPEILLIDLG